MVSPLEVLSQMKLQWQWILSQTFAFLILYWLLRRFAFAPIQRILREREERVRKVIEDAEQQRIEMESLKAEYEQRLAHIEEEARSSLQEAMQQAYQARDALLADAREQAERILQRAQEQIALERGKLMVELRDFVIEMSIRIAEKVIGRNLDGDAHHEIIAEILERELKKRTAH
ncbi:MAG: F0F1 ATP synthase subunit B [Candidatus Fervidibacter sp.]|uniref:F0F1 ATP synthase subunit B n=1 Tax=Candidatus Fervidibacter sp. TaxID=3100871 RepID=UPI00404966B8